MHILQAQLALTGLKGQLVDFAGKPGDIFLIRFFDDRRHDGILGADGKRDVDISFDDDFINGPD
ncbi:hypothetical protein D3C81_1806730 [compost metagenome]